jgi:predicted nucleic acid-binding Zn ribbon protein
MEERTCLNCGYNIDCYPDTTEEIQNICEKCNDQFSEWIPQLPEKTNV